MTTSYPTKLKDPRTCRIFFSSPFGGMEEEREELTRKYFPQIHHLCNSRGIQFVPVDMRWGITSEAAENAQTVNICLRELDRCDIFIGFYGQRYGWHGAENELLQQNFDNAIGRYPWLKDFRDRSATELEFLHGHLNNPGALPACFCFRDKSYDAAKAEDFEKAGDQKMANKYLCESEEAKAKLEMLKDRIQDTEDKLQQPIQDQGQNNGTAFISGRFLEGTETLSVDMNYTTPEAGALHIFEAIWKYLNSVLVTANEYEKISEKEKELAEHDAFMAFRQALYVGGDKYFTQLDRLLTTDVTEKVVVTGQAGQGKSALLANWVSHVRQSHPTAVLAYHFVGASKESGTCENILKRLVWEVSGKSDEDQESNNKTSESEVSTDKDLNTNPEIDSNTADSKAQETPVNADITTELSGDVVTADKAASSTDKNQTSKKENENESKDEDAKEKKKAKKKTIPELISDLQSELEAKKELVVIVIDGLNKIATGKVSKPVYWLPDKFPGNVKIVLSTLDTDTTVIEELITGRHYQNIQMEDLELEHRTQICEKTLEKSGKALSKEQLQKVVDKEQTRNPLFLKIIMAELSVFGYFRKLDEKITTLLTPNSVGELFTKFLERLESDYNTEELPHVVQQVFKVLRISREGLSETELAEMLDMPTHVWSPLYFALEQFIVVHSGLIRFAFSELSDAVDDRYLSEEKDRVEAVELLIEYFDEKRKTFRLWPRTPLAVMKHTVFELPWLQRDINDISGLVQTLSHLLVFHTYIQDNEYDLLELWKLTGVSFNDIADIYVREFDQGLVDIHCLENENQFAMEDEERPPGQRIMSHLENVRYFMDLASCTDGSMKVIKRIIQLLENLENIYKEEKDRVASLAENKYYLACCYSDNGQFSQAEELHHQVMAYWKDGMAKGTVTEKLAETRIAWILNGLGLNRLRQRNYAEAEEYFEECLIFHKKHNNKRNAADTIMNRGLARLRQSKLHMAKDDMEETLKIYEEVFFGKLPHEIGNLYTNLGLIYRRLKRLNEAEKYYFKSLDIKAKSVGWDHLIIATCFMNLGTLEMHRQRWDKAEEYTKKALRIYKVNQVGDDIIEYRHCRENMACCLLRQDKFEEAKPFYWSVYEVLTRLGEMAECLPYVHNTMGRKYLDIGDYENAEKILLALARCPERRKPETFIHLDELYRRKPKTDRPYETTLDFALELWPDKEKLLNCKIQQYYLPHADVDGMMEFYSTKSSKLHLDLVTYIREQDKPRIAMGVMEKTVERFPNQSKVKMYAVKFLSDLKQYEKAAPLIETLSESDMDTETRIVCIRALIGADKRQEAETYIKPLLSSSGISSQDNIAEISELAKELQLQTEHP